jgi:NADPH:quinone reductase-like Zn-dependent oxidoreductase
MHPPGGPEHLFYEEVPAPIPLRGELLVRVHAVCLTTRELSWRASVAAASSYSAYIPGHDVSGVIETMGDDVQGFQPGEEVYALIDPAREGACAEYVCINAADVAMKPQSLGHARAAAVPTAALAAWQALFDHAGLQAGQRVLVHGAAGGVGSLAVQLAHWAGAHVVGTASSEHEPLVRDLGAHEVIDHHAQRFETELDPVDVVLDTVGSGALARSYGVVRRGGVIVSLADPPDPDALTAHAIRGLAFSVAPDRDQLIEIARLVDAGTVRPVIATVFPLAEARAAFERTLQHPSHGQIVLSVIDVP